MTDRYVKNVSLQVKQEATYGAASTFVATDAVLMTRMPEITVESINVDRELHQRFFGASEELPATELIKIKFSTELTPSGVAGTPPPCAPLLRACGFAEVITAASRVNYTPVSEGISSLGFSLHQAGTRYVTRGGRGRVMIDMSVGKIPTADWEFWSFGRTLTEVALPNLDTTAWLTPQVLKPNDASKFTVGATINGTDVLTGGTVARTRSFKIDVGNELQHLMYSTEERIGISDRKITGSYEMGLLAAEEIALVTDIRNVAYTTFAVTHGVGAGNQLQIFGPRVQRTNPQPGDYNGNLIMKADTRYIPQGGDNELKLTFR